MVAQLVVVCIFVKAKANNWRGAIIMPCAMAELSIFWWQ
jgi:hypothetical protein